MNIIYHLWRRGIAVITTDYCTTCELRFCAGSNPGYTMVRIFDNVSGWK